MGGDTVDGVSVVDYAIYNEFGTSRGIPARPFMSTTFDQNKDDLEKFVDHLAGQLIDGKVQVLNVLTQLGMWYQSKVQLTIRNAKEWAAPNAPITEERKGSSSPLIDTGRMVGAVRYVVKQ